MADKNYYDEILSEIAKLIDEDKLDEALENIFEELKVPYIPTDVEEKLQQLYKQVDSLIVDKEMLKIPNKFDLEAIQEILTKEDDDELQVYAIEALKEFNSRKIIDSIIPFLKNNKVKTINKTMMLFVLSEQGVDKAFEVSHPWKQFSINPIQIEIDKYKKILLDSYTILEDTIYLQNPSLHQICKYVLESYYYSVFPFIVEEKQSLNDLCAAAITRGYQIMSLEISNEEIMEMFNFDENNAKDILSMMVVHNIA